MIPVITLSYVIRLLAFTLLFADFNKNNEPAETKPANGFAVVELFTSEGCSSCPAADDGIIELSKEYTGNVYFLGFHVDYWNYLGWKDEYSSSAFTKRQEQYANEFSLNSIYTPQVVINGKKEFVGSDKNRLQQTINDELKTNSSVSIILNAVKDSSNHINISYKITGAGKDEQLLIALVQLMAVTRVKRGENRGRELNHINIVRELKAADLNSSSLQFTFPSNLSAKDVKIVAFMQNKNDLRISGVSETSVQ
jgi:hypothetical protein